jgi:hypothetical protein
LAVAATLATPEALVTADALERVALAPVGGTPKATAIPLRGLPRESLTVACKAFANAPLKDADCGVPPVAVRLAGGPTAFVNENEAVRAPTVAITV